MSERKRSGHESERGKARCPVCAKLATATYRPFCSARCADVDLGRWLKGNYRIPTEEAPDDGAQGPEPGTDTDA